jgi:hypothetical protein
MIATAVLAADYAGILELNDVTTLRGRGTQGQGAGVDFVEAPTASVRVADRLSTYTLTYSPTLTLPDFEQGIHPQLINVGNAIAAWHHRSTSFTVTEGAMYGVLDSAYLQQTQILIPGQQATLNAVPNPGVITVFGSTTDATLRQGVGRRVVLSLSGDYFVSGGADPASRNELPEEYGPRASASVAYTASRLDLLTTRVLVQELRTKGGCPTVATTGTQAPVVGVPPEAGVAFCRERVESVQLDETLRRRLSRTTILTLGAGAAVYDTDAPDLGVQETLLYPVALAQLSYHFGLKGTSELSLYAQLAPNVDPLTGLTAEYLQGSANLTDVFTSSRRLHLGLSALKTTQSSDVYDDVSLVTGSADATLGLDRLTDLSFGVQGLWQEHSDYGTLGSNTVSNQLWSVFAYVALTVRARPMRF